MSECQFCEWLKKHGRLKANTFYYQDKRDYSVRAGVVGEGWLDVHAYADERIGRVEVKAKVEVVGVGTYETPFTIKVPAGTYTLNASYNKQKQSKTAVVEADKTTRVEFEFVAPVVPIPWLQILLPVAFGSVILIPQTFK